MLAYYFQSRYTLEILFDSDHPAHNGRLSFVNRSVVNEGFADLVHELELV